VRCSSCERLLAAYADATLTPRASAQVAGHVAGCATCTSLLEELRVVDALLTTAKPAELPINFTFAVMADVRELPLPAAQRFAWWAATTAYLALAWAVAMALLLGASAGARAATVSLLATLWSQTASAGAALTAASHALGTTTPVAMAVATLVLFADALAFAAIFYFYRNVRPRLAAVVVRSREVR